MTKTKATKATTEAEKQRHLKYNLRYFARAALKIKTKDMKIVPFVFNQSQNYFHNILEGLIKTTGRARVLVVKGRQSGISTYVAARFYHKTSTNHAMGTFILSHEAGTTDKLFKIVKLYNEESPIAPSVRRSNAKELDFETLKSTYYVGTAGSGDVGRGGTIQLFHGSEVAMWKNTDDIETGVLESIPDIDGTEVILESTAKGMGNYFHRMVVDSLAGKNDYTVVFIPWYWMNEYEVDASRFEPAPDDVEYRSLFLKEYDEETAMRKLAWRRNKINNFGSEWKFKQEYPSTVQEAFQTSGDSLINPERVVLARQRQSFVANQAPLVLGVDPARTGDRTAICFRRGREIESIITYDTMDEMRLAGIIAKFIDKYNPVAVNIDCTNSHGTYDRLKELRYRDIHAVHFGSGAIDNEIYLNRRVEMWCLLRDWLRDDVCIPDDDEIATDFLCVPDYNESSDGKIRLISKDKIRQESGLSPDLGDSAALTFATPIRPQTTRAPLKAGGGGITKRRGK